ncbi:MAG: hypothetical protein HZA50_19430 [Planctomycetes bacterium]|nr:hypothetical protein [Planctomycetota bacterium]
MKTFFALVPILTVISAAYYFGAGFSSADSPAGGKSPAASQPQTQSQDNAYIRMLIEDVRNNTPWGKESGGLACRLLVNPKLRVGEPIFMVVEFKNASNEDLSVVAAFSPFVNDAGFLEVTCPDGRKISPKFIRSVITVVAAIESGDTLKVYFADLNEILLFDSSSSWGKPSLFDKPGKYSLAYSFTGRKLPRRPGIEEIKVWENKIEAAATFEIEPMDKDDLVVHEWGVFSIYSDVGYANANMRAEWESLPGFFYRQFPPDNRRMGSVYNMGNVDKPVMYFYSPRPFWRLYVSVDFKEGAPVVWWPCSREPRFETDRTGKTLSKLSHKVVWEALAGDFHPNFSISGNGHLYSNIYGELDIDGKGPWQKASETPLPDDSWMAAARLKKALLINTAGVPDEAAARRVRSVTETERFLYYDGLVPAPDYLRLQSYGGQGPVLCNTGKADIQNLFVIDRRNWQKDKPVRFAQIGRLDAGGEIKVEFEEQPAKDWPAGAVKKVRQVLIDAGLFEEEADSMLKIWEKGLFARDGLTAFYVLPRAEYDRLLPLKIEPAPSAIVRVGLALHPNMATADEIKALEEKIRELAAKLQSNAVAVHKPAMKALLEMGPPIVPFLQKAINESASQELKERGQRVLDQLDAGTYLKETGTEKKTADRDS